MKGLLLEVFRRPNDRLEFDIPNWAEVWRQTSVLNWQSGLVWVCSIVILHVMYVFSEQYCPYKYAIHWAWLDGIEHSIWQALDSTKRSIMNAIGIANYPPFSCLWPLLVLGFGWIWRWHSSNVLASSFCPLSGPSWLFLTCGLANWVCRVGNWFQ